jgi:hypothetical protein
MSSHLETVRNTCLAHPGTMEKLSHGMPAFFLEKGGQFAVYWDDHHGDGVLALLIAMPPGMQESLISEDPETYYRPPYYGPSGWIGVRLDREFVWQEVENLVATGYEFIAAKKKRR